MVPFMALFLRTIFRDLKRDPTLENYPSRVQGLGCRIRGFLELRKLSETLNALRVPSL